MSNNNDRIHIEGNQGDVFGVCIQGYANIIIKNISIAGDINVNKNSYNNLIPEFKDSLDALSHLSKQEKRTTI